MLEGKVEGAECFKRTQCPAIRGSLEGWQCVQKAIAANVGRPGQGKAEEPAPVHGGGRGS